MTVQSRAFGAYFRDHLESGLDDLAGNVDMSKRTFAMTDFAGRRASIQRALVIIAEGIINEDEAPVAAYALQIGEYRARNRFSVEEMMAAFARMRNYVWEHLQTYIATSPPWTALDVRAVEDILHAYQRSYFGGFSVAYQDIQSDLMAQAALLEEQRKLVQELSTPIVPLYEGVLLLPLVGNIDETRAAQITESVLEEIGRSQAEIILVDITGVPVIDTHVANHLITLTRAVSLLGARVVLVGIRAEIAQTIIQLGINISGIVTCANLQTGVVYALQRKGIRI
jgi:rsbT co-antagonist protein RsbR